MIPTAQPWKSCAFYRSACHRRALRQEIFDSCIPNSGQKDQGGHLMSKNARQMRRRGQYRAGQESLDNVDEIIENGTREELERRAWEAAVAHLISQGSHVDREDAERFLHEASAVYVEQSDGSIELEWTRFYGGCIL